VNAEAAVRQRVREELRITVFGMVSNAVLCAAKVLFGLLFNSAAIIADGLHSGSDLASDVAVLWGITAARRPADADHPYGHSRYEAIVTMIVGFLLISAALWVGIESIGTMSAKHAGPTSWLPFWAAIATIAMKEVLYWTTRRVGRKYRNASIVANAWHHRSDAFSSSAAAVGIAGATLGGERWAFLDHLTAVVLAAFLIIIGMRVLREAMHELSDRAPGPATEGRIHSAISNISGVVDFHACRARRSAGVIDMDVHVQVAPDITVQAGHDIATAVEEAVQKAVPEVSDVVVHIEPEETPASDDTRP
jgi:cation diffusion facilitator family transporter